MSIRTIPIALYLVVVASCRSVDITPAALEQNASAPHARVLENWTAAVALANEFLGSSYRRTLPAAHYELRPDGMRFVQAGETLPILVRATTWGDLVVRTGFAAQEREYGFVVGAQAPDRDPLVDHSLFRDGDGKFSAPDSIARTTLHETTHVIFREGTVGFCNSVAYYLEAIFLFRYSNHSAERHANATSEEFAYFKLEREADDEYKSIYREAFDRHLAQGPTAHCRHGRPKK